MVKNPSYKIGKSPRESFSQNLIGLPGPGYYDITNESTTSVIKKNSPRPFFGDSGRNVMNKTILPGPSNYKPFKGLGNEL